MLWTCLNAPESAVQHRVKQLTATYNPTVSGCPTWPRHGHAFSPSRWTHPLSLSYIAEKSHIINSGVMQLSTHDFASNIFGASISTNQAFLSWSELALFGWELWLLKLINKWVWLDSQICTGWLWNLGEVGHGMFQGSVEHNWSIFIFIS